MAKRSTTPKLSSSDSVPLWVSREQAGYDPGSKKWRGKDGRITTKQKALDEALPANKVFGAFVDTKAFNKLDFSRAAERYESLIAGVPPDDIRAGKTIYDYWFERSQKALPVPTYVLARMNLAQHYYDTEGDVSQTIDLPLELGLQPVQVRCRDKGVEDALRQFYSAEEGIDLYDHLGKMWLTVAKYGQAFPVEVWPRKGQQESTIGVQASKKTEQGIDPGAIDIKGELYENDFDRSVLPTICHLYPKNVWVNEMIVAGQFDYAIAPTDVDKWTAELALDNIPKLMWFSVNRNINEHLKNGRIPLNPEYCQPIHAKKDDWERYAMPPLSRALRAISTRQALETLIRSTIEGYKNQLWLFLLGDADHLPSPQEISKLQSTLSGQSGELTSWLVWRNSPLKVEQHAPKPLDQMLGNEMWQHLTWHIFRQLGVNLRLVSGETVGRASSSDLELDIDLLVARVGWWQRNLYKWERHYRMNWAKWDGSASAKKYAPLATVEFGKLDITTKMAIRDRIVPLLQTGKLSDHTALEEAGLNYETELERKKDEAANKELFSVQPTFAQTTVNPNAPEKKADNAPQGRPRRGTKNADQEQEAEGSIIWDAVRL